jgi:adenylate cyclase
MTVPVEHFEKDGKFYIKYPYILNPNRYEVRTIKGVEYQYDKFEDVSISTAEIEKAIQAQKGNKNYSVIPKIFSPDKYIAERQQNVLDYLDGQEEQYQRVDKSEEFLASLEKDYEMRFAILCIDMIGSTKLSLEIPAEANSQIISLFAREMSAIVDNFKGYVLKYVGDGLIAYFPIVGKVPMDDNSVDCSMAMKYYIENSLNPILTDRKLSPIKFRIGLDSGEAIVKIIGDASTKQQKDLIGATINLASKIQGKADDNSILIGDTTLKGLHTDKRICFARDGEYEMPNNESPYPLHAMTKYPDKQSFVMSS